VASADKRFGTGFVFGIKFENKKIVEDVFKRLQHLVSNEN
jgi:hypothetical protein